MSWVKLKLIRQKLLLHWDYLSRQSSNCSLGIFYIQEQQAFLSTRHIVRDWIQLNRIKIFWVALNVATAFCEPKRVSIDLCWIHTVELQAHSVAVGWSATVSLPDWEVPECHGWWPAMRECVWSGGRVSPDVNRVIRGLIKGSQEPAKPPTDSIIAAVVAGSLPPCCWGFGARIENVLVCTPHWMCVWVEF